MLSEGDWRGRGGGGGGNEWGFVMGAAAADRADKALRLKIKCS